MWRSVFLHEFIDHRIDNFQALPGSATPASMTLAASDAAVPGVNAIRVQPGTGFEYVLATPLAQVIGVSCRVRLLYPLNPVPRVFPLIQLGGGAQLLLSPATHPLPDLSGTVSKAQVRIGTTSKDLGIIILPAQAFTDFRFDWHTSGQARILANGRLVAYTNGVVPGAAFAVDRVVFGMPTLPPAPQPSFHISRVFVRTLERSDSLGQVAGLLPAVGMPPDHQRCRPRAVANMQAMVDQMRQFMAQIHAVLSRPWSEGTGPAIGPFKPEAVKAHDLAMVAGAAFVDMLKTRNFSTPERFLDPFTAFLRLLRDALPQEFAAFAVKMDVPIVPDDCRTMFEAVLQDNAEAFKPIITLLSEASERIRQIAGGN